jgi:hypothetical protein
MKSNTVEAGPSSTTPVSYKQITDSPQLLILSDAVLGIGIIYSEARNLVSNQLLFGPGF